MFKDLDEVMAAVESLTTTELTQLGVLAVVEHLAGNITTEQFQTVALLVADLLDQRMAEKTFAAVATVN